MGRIALILSFVRSLAGEAKVSDVKVNPGGGANITAQHFAPAGDDAHPLPADYVATMRVQRTGSEVAVGYLDPKNEQKSQPGDKRIYARGPEDGTATVEVWLKSDGTALTSNAKGSTTLSPDGSSTVVTPEATFSAEADGSIKGSNSAGSFELQAGGNFVVNGVTIDTSGNISTAGKVNADDVTADNQNVTLSTHKHPAPNTPPTPGT